jgi:hypothetical protein
MNPPTSFLVFAVAKLKGRYRQLAVVRNETGSFDLDFERKWLAILRACRTVITTLSDPANRAAIQGELALADAAYAHGGLAPPRSELESTDPYILCMSWDGISLLVLVELDPTENPKNLFESLQNRASFIF